MDVSNTIVPQMNVSSTNLVLRYIHLRDKLFRMEGVHRGGCARAPAAHRGEAYLIVEHMVVCWPCSPLENKWKTRLVCLK